MLPDGAPEVELADWSLPEGVVPPAGAGAIAEAPPLEAETAAVGSLDGALGVVEVELGGVGEVLGAGELLLFIGLVPLLESLVLLHAPRPRAAASARVKRVLLGVVIVASPEAKAGHAGEWSLAGVFVALQE